IMLKGWDETPVTWAYLDSVLDHGVAAIFPNDYASVQNAILAGELVDDKTELGKTYLSLARILAGVPDPSSPPKSVLHFLKSLGTRKRVEEPVRPAPGNGPLRSFI